MEIKLQDLLNKRIKDEIIAFQTDTVYGVGCLLDSVEGIEKIYRLKRRDPEKPLAVLCASIEEVRQLVIENESFRKISEKYWPGALTVVAKKTDKVPDIVTKSSPKVGVRIPKDDTALALLKRFGPMAVTSLNLSQEPPVLSYHEALTFVNQVDYLVEGTDVAGVSSTVYDIETRQVLRQGAIVIGKDEH